MISLRLSGNQLPKDIFQGGISQSLDFGVAAILNRMGHIAGGRRKTKRFALGGRRFDELAGCHEHAGNATIFQFRDVVHTARRA